MNTTQKKPVDKKKPTEKLIKKKNKKFSAPDIIAGILVFVIICGLIVGGIGLKILSDMIKTAPTLSMSDFQNTENTQIFDSEGNLIAEVGNVLRENVTYDELPEALVDALISVEDSRFFEHNGFDIPRFAKAMIENLRSMSFAQGGSTLSMQLVKNTYFTNNDTTIATKSIDRKVQEIFLTMDFEKETNKKTIIEYYLNKMNFGATSRGVQKAALYYFGKEVSELNLSECALLAGVVNSPNYFNPYYHLDHATSRRNTVLDLMVHHGYITKQEADLAKSVNIEDLLVGLTSRIEGTAIPYQSYIDVVLDEVYALTGQDPYDVPMRIYTAMRKDVQEEIDAIQNDERLDIVRFPDDLMQISIVSLDNHTGEIVGLGGGRNYVGQRVYNRASSMYKQPGSSVKPFLSYALAFEHLGWATSHTVTDAPIVYRGTSTQINNFDGVYRGEISLYDAVGKSLNTPAITTLETLVDNHGYSMVVNYLQALGFSHVNLDNFDIGFAIGGSNFEVTPIELAGAHATMINSGQYITPHTVTKIEYMDGSNPYIPSYTATQAISEEAAYMTADLMRAATTSSYANYMQILQRSYPVYGKTGTTDWGTSGTQYNIPIGAAKDKWMVASTSNYTNCVWVGYDKGIKDAQTYFTSEKSSRNIPGNISKLMLDVLEKGDEGAINRPVGVQNIEHIVGTFPYASVIEGMNEEYITRGMIKKEFNQTVDSNDITMENLSAFDAEATVKDGKVVLSLNWAKYPNEEQLSIAPNTKEFTLPIKNLTITGNRMFDWSWVYGAVRYKSVITNESGEILGEFTSDTEQKVEEVDVIPGSIINACGFYAFENEKGPKSNEICKSFKIEDLDIKTPSNTATKAEIDQWINTMQNYGISVKTEEGTQTENQVNYTNMITYDNIVMNDNTYSLSSLVGKRITVTYLSEKTIIIPNYIGMSEDEFRSWSSKTLKNSVVNGDDPSISGQYITNDLDMDGKVAYVYGLTNLGYVGGEEVKVSVLESFIVYYYQYVPDENPDPEED